MAHLTTAQTSITVQSQDTTSSVVSGEGVTTVSTEGTMPADITSSILNEPTTAPLEITDSITTTPQEPVATSDDATTTGAPAVGETEAIEDTKLLGHAEATTSSRIMEADGFALDVLKISDLWQKRLLQMGIEPSSMLTLVVPPYSDEEKQALQARRHYFQGCYHLEMGDETKALEQLEKAQKLDPDNTAILLKLVRAELAARDFDEALVNLTRVLDMETTNVEALTLQAQLYAVQADASSDAEKRPLIDSAVKSFEKARALEPKNLDVLKGLAGAYVQQQKIDDVIRTYREIVAVNPKDTYSLLILAQVLSRMDRNDEAIAYYEKVIEQRRGFIGGYIYLAQLYERLDRQRDAIAVYKKALLVDSRNEDVLKRFEALLAKMYGTKGLQQILAQYEKFAREYPNSSEIQRLYAERLVTAEDIKAAAKQYEKVIAIDSDSIDSILSLATIRLQLKQYQEAGELFGSAIEIDPTRVEVYDAMAASLLQQNRGKEALDVYEKAMRNSPKTEKLYVNYAVLLDRENRTTEAISVLEKGVSAVVGNSDLFVALGKLYHDTKQTSKAVESLEKAMKVAPEDRTVAGTLLTIYLENEERAKFFELTEQLALKGDKAAIYSFAGLLAFQLAWPDIAVELQAKARATDPERLDYLIREVYALTTLQRFDEALKILEESKEAFPDEEQYKLTVVRILSQAERLEEAVKIGREVLVSDPKNLDAFDLLVEAITQIDNEPGLKELLAEADAKLSKAESGTVRAVAAYKLKDYSRAEKLFLELIKTTDKEDEEKLGEYNLMLASIYMDQDRFREAERSLKKTIELLPQNSNALNALGYMYADRNTKLVEARTLVEQALQLDPGAPHILDSMGWIYFREGNYEKALHYVTKASRLMNDSEIYEHLGDIYQASGDTAKAQENYLKALKLDPERKSLTSKVKK